MGDFEVAENFGPDDDGNPSTTYMWAFYIVFFIGTLINMLILLNMVLAVMGSAFNKVKENEQAVIVRQNLSDVAFNYYRFDADLKKRLSENKYLLTIEVNPKEDPIAVESMETRLRSRISGIIKFVNSMSETLDRITLNQGNLFDRLCSQNRLESEETTS